MDFFEALNNISKNVTTREDMRKHTSFKIGGGADYMVCAEDYREIKDVILLCREKNIPYMVMGNGSNMLVSDKGIEGVIIKISEKLANITVMGDKIIAQAGALLSTVANRAMESELSGLEFAAGIPGTIGGAMVMNAGAYGGEMKDIVTKVGYMDKTGDIFEIPGDEAEFGYRKSIFSKGEYIVLYCEMQLKKGNKDEIKATMSELNQRRRDKQPINLPSAGSTFKRPEGYFAGKLIEDAGLKGYRIGGAEVSQKHSGFLVNVDNATAQDVNDLISHVQNVVFEKFGVKLEPEIKIYGR